MKPYVCAFFIFLINLFSVGLNFGFPNKSTCQHSRSSNFNNSLPTEPAPCYAFCDNRTPLFTTQPLTSVRATDPYRYEFRAEDPDRDPLAERLVSGPTGMSYDAASQTGNHSIRIRATNSFGKSLVQSYSVSVDSRDRTAPLVHINAAKKSWALGESMPLEVAVYDAVGVRSVRLQVTGPGLPALGQELVLDSTRRVVFVPGEPGVFHFAAWAEDAAGNLGSHQTALWVADSADLDAPFVEIWSPVEGGVVTAPTQINGTVQDARLAEWNLSIQRVGGDCPHEIARGNEAFDRADFAELDPTLFENGLYYLRLEAFDTSNRGLYHEIVIALDGGMKVGRFDISFKDHALPLRGLPAQVLRRYDATDKCSGDFGYGWRLAQPRFQANMVLGNRWEIDEQQFCVTPNGPIYPPFANCNGQTFPYTCVAKGGEHFIAVTLPGGRTEIFDMEVDTVGNAQPCYEFYFPDAVEPVFKPRPGVKSRLSLPRFTTLFLRQFEDEQTGELEWKLTADLLEPWMPSEVQLTTPEGIVFLIGPDGLHRVTDLEGNSLEYSRNGILHSSGESISFTRDSQGRISQTSDPDGTIWRYSYDERGDLIAVTDPEGGVTRYEYDDNHGLVRIQTPDGNVPVRNYYNEQGRLIAREDGNGNRVAYSHDLAGRQDFVYDSYGNATYYLYDTRGNVLQQTDALGRTTTYSYDGDDNETSKTLAYGTAVEARVESAYDDKHNLLEERDLLGALMRYGYDGKGNPTRVENSAGQVTAFEYDSAGRPLAILDSMGGAIRSQYSTIDAGSSIYFQIETTDALGTARRQIEHASGLPFREFEPNGLMRQYHFTRGGQKTIQIETLPDGTRLETRWGYDRNGNQTSETNALGQVTRMTYSPAGLLTSQTDALGRVTRFEYDGNGKLAATIHPDGVREAVSFDEHGHELLRMDGAGRITRNILDQVGQIRQIHQPDGTWVSQEYDEAGRLTSRTNERGQVTYYEYDLAGRKTAEIDALGGRSGYEYNLEGQLIRFTDANGRVTHYEYDPKNRLTETRYPDGSSKRVVYDALDRRIQETDQAGASNFFAYDEMSNLIGVTDARGAVTRFEYDALGRKTAQIDAEGRRTSWAYDALGRVIERKLPLGQVERLSYDAAGNLASHTDFNGQTTQYFYDSRNRIARKRFADGSEERYGYTATGQRAWAEDGRGRRTYLYDSRDRLIRMDEPEGTWVLYEYDEAGNTTLVETPYARTSYSYDALNRLASVVDQDGGVTSYGYDAVGNRTSVTSANGVVTNYVYDELNRLVSMDTRDQGGALLTSYAYELLPDGNRAKITEHNGRVTSYVYDELKRLVEERIQDPVKGESIERFEYDQVGNRRSKTTYRVINGQLSRESAEVYDYDANDRLLEVRPAGSTGAVPGLSSFTYDEAGNPLAETSVTAAGAVVKRYDYDAQNRLIAASTPESQLNYGYDVDGIRVAKWENGALTHFLVDYQQRYAQVLSEVGDDGVSRVNYTYGDDLLSQHRTSGTHYYYHYDGHGSVTALTDEQGRITDSYHYNAWGQLLEQSGSTENHYRYTGEQHDPNLGFYYLRARYMDPRTGRFLTSDKWSGDTQDPITLHKYLYANASPVINIDPTGYFSLSEISLSQAINRILNAYTWGNIGLKFASGDVQGAGEDALEEIGTAVLLGGLGGLIIKSKPLLRKIGRLFKRGCFIAGTLVITDQGLKPIECIEEGDYVLSQGENGGAPEFKQVVQTEITETDTLYEVTYQNSSTEEVETISCTGDHPFWVEEHQEWVPAEDLKPGYHLISSQNRLSHVIKIQIIRGPPKAWTTYNFEVKEHHTYFVQPSEAQEEGVLVHNNCGGLLKLNRDNFRENVIRFTGKALGDAQAHHIFPVKFEREFKNIGIEIHHPKFGTWWNKNEHLKASKEYQDRWAGFLIEQDNFTPEKVLQFGRELAIEYGLMIYF